MILSLSSEPSTGTSSVIFSLNRWALCNSRPVSNASLLLAGQRGNTAQHSQHMITKCKKMIFCICLTGRWVSRQEQAASALSSWTRVCTAARDDTGTGGAGKQLRQDAKKAFPAFKHTCRYSTLCRNTHTYTHTHTQAHLTHFHLRTQQMA